MTEEACIKAIDIEEQNSDSTVETVEFVLIYQNQRLQIKFDLDSTILKLKEHVQTLTGNIYNF